MTTLPTPCARDGKGPGHQYGLPDLIEGGNRPSDLLPTPTSGGGTSHLSDVAHRTATIHRGRAGSRPEAPAEPGTLLPTPTASPYGSNQSMSAGAAVRPSLATLAAHRLLPTPLPDAAGPPPHPSAVAEQCGTRAGSRPQALLPTPRTSDGRGPAVHGDGGADLSTAVWRLLPTPKASDGVKGCPAQRGSKGDLTLPSAAVRLDPVHNGRAGTGRLLPTPRVAAARTGRRAATSPDSRSGPSLEQAAEIADGVLPRELDSWARAPAAWQPPAGPGAGRAWGPYAGRAWGPYAEAVARWERLLGRPAPAPTQPGTHGRPVLAPPFVEWLMGLPAGFVTDLGLPRTLALRVLGNGVCPQQAVVALRLLLCPHRWAVKP